MKTLMIFLSIVLLCKATPVFAYSEEERAIDDNTAAIQNFMVYEQNRDAQRDREEQHRRHKEKFEKEMREMQDDIDRNLSE